MVKKGYHSLWQADYTLDFNECMYEGVWHAQKKLGPHTFGSGEYIFVVWPVISFCEFDYVDKRDNFSLPLMDVKENHVFDRGK